MPLRRLTIAVAFVLVACERQPQADPVSDRPPAKKTAAASATSAEAPQAPAWPPPPPQPVELSEHLLARNYYIVLDGSGSMADRGCSGSRSKRAVAVDAILEFARAVPAEANLGLATFDGRGVGERLTLGVGNREGFVNQVNASRPRGGTPLRTAIERGYRALTAQAQRQGGYGEYHLVVVTDGMADPPDEDPRAIVDRILADSPVVVHTIGFCIGSEHSLNQPGRTIYRAANNPAELGAGLAAVLAEAESFTVASF